LPKVEFFNAVVVFVQNKHKSV